jgi:hypothetical protein
VTDEAGRGLIGDDGHGVLEDLAVAGAPCGQS